VTRALLESAPAAATSMLQQLGADPEVPGPLRTLIEALQAIVGGSRDRSLADAPDVDCTMAAEILLLIETLEKRGL
jgi:hypothetical protein